MKIIVCMRHGEAYKNLKNIDGGKGSGLTERGIFQVLNSITKLQNLKEKYQLPIKIFVSCKRPQIIESSKLVAKKLGVNKLSMHENFIPIKLGSFNGLSKEEQLRICPEAVIALKQWENGMADITEVEKLMPDMQKSADYFLQMKDFVNSLKDNTINILVGTRSDLSCVINVLNENSIYKCNKFDFAQVIIAVQKENEKFTIYDENYQHGLE